MSSTVSDEPARARFEIREDGRLAGFVEYGLEPGRITFTHTQTEPEFSGQGLARQLVAEALADARRRGLAVLPSCPYVRGFIARNAADYLDLVPQAERHRFELDGQ